MRVLLALFFIMISLGYEMKALDQSWDDKKDLLENLEAQGRILANIEEDIPDEFRPRHRALSNSVARALTTLNEPDVKLYSKVVQDQLVDHLFKIRHSESFFKEIRSSYHSDNIDKLIMIHETIVKDLGYGDAPYTFNTKSIFDQMYRLFAQMKLELKGQQWESLVKKIDQMSYQLADVTAKGHLGDRLYVFIHGVNLHFEIQKLYIEFDRIRNVGSAFDIAMEIRGLNEIYAEFARFDFLTTRDILPLARFLMERELLIENYSKGIMVDLSPDKEMEALIAFVENLLEELKEELKKLRPKEQVAL